MNSKEPIEKDAETNNNKTNNKNAATQENGTEQLTLTSSALTVVKLEGTHTTATDTDALKLEVNEMSLQTPETSEKIRGELENFNSVLVECGTTRRNLTMAKNEIDIERAGGNETLQRPVEDMILEIHGYIQAIINMFNKNQNKIEEEKVSTFYQSELAKESRGALKTVGEINHIVVDTQPISIQNKNLLDLRLLPTFQSSSALPNLVNAELACFDGGVSEEIGNVETVENDTEFTCVTLTDACYNNNDAVIVPLNIGEGLSTSLAPCESAYHTLHIHASTSPTSSVMFRPPICVRLRMVVTDFFTAICLCLQVNRDCIFCLGFFIAFVVSASFLTAFFYRTLSFDPQGFRNQKYQHQMERDSPAAFSTRPGYFY